MQATQSLILRITDNSLSFAQSRDSGKVVNYELYDIKLGISLETNLREAFQRSPLLRKAKGSVVVTTDAPVLLVPIDDYGEQVKEQYKYAYPNVDNVVLFSTMLPLLKAVAVFAISKDLGVVLTDHFDDVHIEPLMLRLWDYLMHRDESRESKTMYVYFHESKMEICSFFHRRFVFANTFSAASAQDAVYFILGAWQQINAKGEKDNLVLCGNIPEQEATTQELQQYIRNIACIDAAQEIDKALTEQAESMPLDLMLQFVGTP